MKRAPMRLSICSASASRWVTRIGVANSERPQRLRCSISRWPGGLLEQEPGLLEADDLVAAAVGAEDPHGERDHQPQDGLADAARPRRARSSARPGQRARELADADARHLLGGDPGRHALGGGEAEPGEAAARVGLDRAPGRARVLVALEQLGDDVEAGGLPGLRGGRRRPGRRGGSRCARWPGRGSAAGRRGSWWRGPRGCARRRRAAGRAAPASAGRRRARSPRRGRRSPAARSSGGRPWGRCRRPASPAGWPGTSGTAAAWSCPSPGVPAHSSDGGRAERQASVRSNSTGSSAALRVLAITGPGLGADMRGGGRHHRRELLGQQHAVVVAGPGRAGPGRWPTNSLSCRSLGRSSFGAVPYSRRRRATRRSSSSRLGGADRERDGGAQHAGPVGAGEAGLELARQLWALVGLGARARGRRGSPPRRCCRRARARGGPSRPPSRWRCAVR